MVELVETVPLYFGKAGWGFPGATAGPEKGSLQVILGSHRPDLCRRARGPWLLLPCPRNEMQ